MGSWYPCAHLNARQDGNLTGQAMQLTHSDFCRSLHSSLPIYIVVGSVRWIRFNLILINRQKLFPESPFGDHSIPSFQILVSPLFPRFNRSGSGFMAQVIGEGQILMRISGSETEGKTWKRKRQDFEINPAALFMHCIFRSVQVFALYSF